MTLQVGKIYKIRIIVDNNSLVYTAKITSVDSNFITFIDKNEETWNYNISTIASYQEIEETK